VRIVGIDWYRDLVICIWGFLAIIFLIIITILLFLLYKRVQKIMNSVDSICNKSNSILDSVEDSAAGFKGIITDIREEIMNPLVQVMSVIQSIRQIIGIFSQFKKKGEEAEDG
jgi:hypothetical protein